VRSRRPTVAVIIPTYNHARFLAAAIRSVTAQTQPADGIIVVDDGSQDDPASVVRGFRDVKLLRRENGGLAAARNTGLGATAADKVIFLDADDLLHPEAIEAGLAAFAGAPDAAFVYGAHRRIDERGRIVAAYKYRAIGENPYVDFLKLNMVGMHGAVMYDRQALCAAGGFDASLRRCEDYDVYLRLSRTGAVASHEAVVADYRWHGDNLSTNNAEMLDWALRVHAAQAGFARQRPETLTAWESGRRIWKDYYALETLKSVSGRRPVERLSGLAVALKVSPAFTLRRGAAGLKQGLVKWVKTMTSGSPRRVGAVDFGDFGTTRPISLNFGFDRGTPVDRYYVEGFLARHASDIRGRVLEVGDASYSRRFGGAAVTHQDVLHVSRDAPEATLVGDMAEPGVLPDGVFDCIVLTQTLHLIYDTRAALAQVHRALAPGGIVLLTVPGISQLDRGEWRETWSWSFTPYSARRLFEEVFEEDELEVDGHGNVFAATAFLQGVALEEVDKNKLDEVDLAYPVTITVRARRGTA
jgi:glycosyltransferase involved in cell wall biosynthesis/SAM-dependent methyltransferase